jgi:4-aminobutyrate aminotransferase-like enzyme
VALRNIDILEQEGLIDRAAVLGTRLLTGLEGLREHAIVGDVRGLGMMCGVELVEDRASRAPALGIGNKVAAEARKRGLFTRNRGGVKSPFPIGDTICVAPPLVTTEEQIDTIVTILHEAIRAAMA